MPISELVAASWAADTTDCEMGSEAAAFLLGMEVILGRLSPSPPEGDPIPAPLLRACC